VGGKRRLVLAVAGFLVLGVVAVAVAGALITRPAEPPPIK
jgi:hypothetical protein